MRSDSGLSLLAQIAPQRSTQYAELADALAPHELRLSRLGRSLADLHWITLAGQHYLHLALADEPTPEHLYELGTLATLSAFLSITKHWRGWMVRFCSPARPDTRPRCRPIC